MNVEEERSREKQAVLDYVQTAQVLDEHGFLDLECFCVMLSRCFDCDDALRGSPQPVAMYEQLLKRVDRHCGRKALEKYVQRFPIKDWNPEQSHFYPEGKATLVSPAVLVKVFGEWIADIGYVLMAMPHPGEPVAYYDWVKPEWVTVRAYLDRFHMQMTEWMQKGDLALQHTHGYSFFEAMHVAKTTGRPFDDVIALLRRRGEVQEDALARVQQAIDDGYFLEAVVLQECVISNCLFNFLRGSGQSQPPATFYELIKHSKKIVSGSEVRELLGRVNRWRKRRNEAVHGFVVSRVENLGESRAGFVDASKTTAGDGLELTEQVVAWYKSEAVQFLDTEFPKPPGPTLQ